MKKSRNFTAFAIGLVAALFFLFISSCGSKDSHVKDLYSQIDSLNSVIEKRDTIIKLSDECIAAKDAYVDALKELADALKHERDAKDLSVTTLLIFVSDNGLSNKFDRYLEDEKYKYDYRYIRKISELIEK